MPFTQVGTSLLSNVATKTQFQFVIFCCAFVFTEVTLEKSFRSDKRGCTIRLTVFEVRTYRLYVYSVFVIVHEWIDIFMCKDLQRRHRQQVFFAFCSNVLCLNASCETFKSQSMSLHIRWMKWNCKEKMNRISTLAHFNLSISSHEKWIHWDSAEEKRKQKLKTNWTWCADIVQFATVRRA